MNILKRRKTVVRGRDKVQKTMMRPLFEDMTPLKPEYELEATCKLYELESRKKKDTDDIPVHIAMFGELKYLLNQKDSF